jgi:hypothetical protein
VGRRGFFEQPLPAMPISDYASAFFFAHRYRVTLQRYSMLLRSRCCYFKSAADQRLMAKSSQPSRQQQSALRNVLSRNTERRKFHSRRASRWPRSMTASSEIKRAWKSKGPEKKSLATKAPPIKKPGTAGLLTNVCFVQLTWQFTWLPLLA